MRIQKKISHFSALQISVALFGGASIFGYLLPLNPILLVWGRTVWASLFLLVLMILSKERINCMCTAILYDPKDHYEPEETKQFFEENSKGLERLFRIRQWKLLKPFLKNV
jgi:glycerol-3-phosphate acyltransferase PlsY